MTAFYLELYKGSIPDAWSTLPGAGNYDPGNEGYYWAVLIALPPGSQEQAFLAPCQPSGIVHAATHGTDTLPPGTSQCIPTRICIWSPKEPPYWFDVIAPDGTQVQLHPSAGSDDASWSCASPGIRQGIGIWTIRVMPKDADLPEVIAPRHASLNPDRLTFDQAHFFVQPLLRLEVDQVKCPELRSLVATSGCAPGTVTYQASIDGDLSQVAQLIWEFGDGTDPVTVAQPQIASPAIVSHFYASTPQAPALARVTIVRPAECGLMSQSREVGIPLCGDHAPECPAITDLVVVQGCAPLRAIQDQEPPTVGFRVTFSGPGSDIEEISWDFGDGSPEVVSPSPYNSPVEVYHPYTAAPANPLAVTLLRRVGCTPRTDSRSLDVPTCLLCPELSGITATGCASGDVTLTADGSDLEAVESYDWVFGDGQTATAGRTVTHHYSGSGPYTASVTIVRPANCVPRTRDKEIVVSGCGSTTTTTNGSNGGTPSIPWCLIWLVLAMLAILIGGALAAVAICFATIADWLVATLVTLGIISAGSTTAVGLALVIIIIAMFVVGLMLLIGGNMALLLWLFFCGSCRANCSMLENLRWTLASLIAVEVVIGLIGAILSAMWGGIGLCGVGWFLTAVDLGLLLIIVFYYGAMVGCWPWAPGFPRWARLRIPDPARFVCHEK